MDKIQKIKEEVLVVEVDIMQDCYPGNPRYIGMQSHKKTNEFLIKSCQEQNLEIPDIGGPYHYFPVCISESEIESYYNDALFLIPNMTLSSLKFTLNELESYSYKELLGALDVLSSRFANDETDCDSARIDVKRFKYIYRKTFNKQLSICGKVTSYFVGSMRRELQLRNKYLDMLRNKFKEMIAIEEEAAPSLQSNANSRILKNKTSFEDSSYFRNEKYKNMNEREVLNKIEELTATEYEEGYYLGGYNDSKLTTLEHGVIQKTFSDIYDELILVFRQLYLKGNFDLLRRIRVILHDDLKNISDLYKAGEWVPKCNYDIDFDEFMDRDKSFELVYLYKTDYIQKLIDKLDGYASKTGENNTQQTAKGEAVKKSAVSSSDNNANVKTKSKERTINRDKLVQYFKSSFNRENPINYFDRLIEELKSDRTSKEFGEIALMIHNSKHINNRVPKVFNKWFVIFCDCIDIKKPTYKKGKLSDPDYNLRELFNYL